VRQSRVPTRTQADRQRAEEEAVGRALADRVDALHAAGGGEGTASALSFALPSGGGGGGGGGSGFELPEWLRAMNSE
jgi:hypothetical protein